MTQTKVAEISEQIETLSYDETVSIISLLVDKLKTLSVKLPAENKKRASLEKAFALSDSLNMSSHGAKLNREELYDR